MILTSLVLASCPAALATPRSAAPAERSLDEILSAVRGALASERLAGVPEGYRVSGRSTEYGVEGDFDVVFDAEGRFRQAVRSPLGETLAFDGSSAWGQDAAGVTRRLSFGARVTTQSHVWIATGLWARSEGPFEVELVESADGAETVTLRLRRRDEPWEGTLSVRTDDWLPQALVHQRPAGERHYRFDNWLESPGARYPGLVEVTDVAGDVSRYEATEITRAPAFFRSPYEPIFVRPGDGAFDPDAPNEVEARRAATGHLLVHPRLGGKDVGWFVLDTGAGALCIDPEVAEGAGMEQLGEVSLVGAGGATRSHFRRGAQLTVGPLTLPDVPWIEVDTEFLAEAFDLPVAGILGYELFARAVIDVDLSAPRVALFDPATFDRAPAAAELDWLELRLDDRLPCLRASFEGDREGWFRIDSGSNDTLTFHSPAVEALDLLSGRSTRGARHAGVGGKGAARRGPLAWFQLAGIRFEDLTVTFSTARASGLATPYTTGNVGSGVLEHFRMTFDFGGERAAFTRTGQ